MGRSIHGGDNCGGYGRPPQFLCLCGYRGKILNFSRCPLKFLGYQLKAEECGAERRPSPLNFLALRGKPIFEPESFVNTLITRCGLGVHASPAQPLHQRKL
jgi:hypothetical protein